MASETEVKKETFKEITALLQRASHSSKALLALVDKIEPEVDSFETRHLHTLVKALNRRNSKNPLKKVERVKKKLLAELERREMHTLKKRQKKKKPVRIDKAHPLRFLTK